MSMEVATPPQTEEIAPFEDDRLADAIRDITREQVDALWAVCLQHNPRLADLT
jgi:hypothetical protein